MTEIRHKLTRDTETIYGAMNHELIAWPPMVMVVTTCLKQEKTWYATLLFNIVFYGYLRVFGCFLKMTIVALQLQ